MSAAGKYVPLVCLDTETGRVRRYRRVQLAGLAPVKLQAESVVEPWSQRGPNHETLPQVIEDFRKAAA